MTRDILPPQWQLQKFCEAASCRQHQTEIFVTRRSRWPVTRARDASLERDFIRISYEMHTPDASRR